MIPDKTYLVQCKFFSKPENLWSNHAEFPTVEMAISKARQLNEVVRHGEGMHRVVEKPTGVEKYRRGYIIDKPYTPTGV